MGYKTFLCKFPATPMTLHLRTWLQVCMDCGLQPQQAVVGFLGRQEIKIIALL